MARVKYRSKEIDLLARLMKAEALGEGNYGMLLVGNVGINRVVAKCQVFKKITTITQMVYQNPSGFEGTGSKLFNAGSNAKQRKLAKWAIDYWRGHPATKALFFKNPGKNVSCPKRFYGDLVGKYKQHCFYNPDNIKECGL